MLFKFDYFNRGEAIEMAKIDIDHIRSFKDNIASDKVYSIEDIISLVNPSLGEKVLLIGNIRNAGKYIRKLGAEVKIVQNEDQPFDSTSYLKNESCEFINCCLDNMPFKDDFFDKVIFMQGFNSFREEAKVLNEITRVLKPQGQILIEEHNCKGLQTKIESIKSAISGDYCKYYKAAELSALLKKIGIEGTFENISKNKYIYLGTKTIEVS